MLKVLTVKLMPSELEALLKAADSLPALHYDQWTRAEILALDNARSALKIAKAATRELGPIAVSPIPFEEKTA